MAYDLFHRVPNAGVADPLKLWLLSPLLLVFLTSCSGKGGRLLTFLSEEDKEPDYGTVLESSPEQVNNLVSWFKTDDLVTISSTTNQVSQWQSSTNDGTALVVGSGKAAPPVVPWGPGKALSFSSSLQHGLEMPGFTLGAFETFSIVLVVQAKSPGPVLYFGSDLYSKDDSGIIAFGDGGKLQVQHVTTAGSDYNSKETVLHDWNQPHVVIATFAPSSDWRDNHIYIDGFRVETANGSTVGTPTPFVSLIRHLNIGPTTAGTNFVIAEVAVYGRQLSPRDAYSLSKNLGRKWQIPIKEKISKEIFEDRIDNGIKEITFESLKRDIFATKGCLGCHNSSMKADGIDLSTYEGLRTGVSASSGKRVAIPGQATSSGLYTSVTGAVPQMPRLAATFGGYLSAAQTAEISVWINKGMKENESSPPLPPEGGTTDEDGDTDEDTLGFLAFDDVYYGVLNTKCLNCHNPSKKNGGIDLSSYVSLRGAKNKNNQDLVVPGSPDSSRLYQVVSGVGLTNNTPTMPGSGIYLSTEEKNLIKSWIEQGALQNVMSILTGPTGFTSATSASFTFSGKAPATAAIAGYECSLDGSTFSSCVSGVTYSSLSMQGHTFQVRYLDSNGNRSTPSAASWTVDFLAPEIPTVTNPPALLTKVKNPKFTFTSTDNGISGMNKFECSVDSNPFSDCTSNQNLTAVTDGDHSFRVRAVDHAGNRSDPTTPYTWKVDSVVDVTTLGSISATINSSTPLNISWTASDTNGLATNPIRLEYSTNGTTWTAIATAIPNTPPYAWTVPTSLNGTTTLKIRVTTTDKATNTKTATSANIKVIP